MHAALCLKKSRQTCCWCVISKLDPRTCWKCFKCGMFWSLSVRFLLVPRFSSELGASQKIQRFPRCVLTAGGFSRFLLVTVWYNHALIQEQRNWFWTLFWGVRVQTTDRDLTVRDWRCQFRVKLHRQCVTFTLWRWILQTFHCHLFYTNTKIRQSEFFQSVLVHMKPTGSLTAPWELSIEIQTNKKTFNVPARQIREYKHLKTRLDHERVKKQIRSSLQHQHSPVKINQGAFLRRR